MWKEMRALYRYWKVERPMMGGRVEKALRRWARDYRYKLVPRPDGRTSAIVVTRNNRQAWTRLCRLEERFDRTEDRMLQRLVNIRRHLWC
jgi:2-polyprenyl-6-methoxyphenol hydroxylase-like FAD-dependent oxidoreductase